MNTTNVLLLILCAVAAFVAIGIVVMHFARWRYDRRREQERQRERATAAERVAARLRADVEARRATAARPRVTTHIPPRPLPPIHQRDAFRRPTPAEAVKARNDDELIDVTRIGMAAAMAAAPAWSRPSSDDDKFSGGGGSFGGAGALGSWDSGSNSGGDSGSSSSSGSTD